MLRKSLPMYVVTYTIRVWSWYLFICFHYFSNLLHSSDACILFLYTSACLMVGILDFLRTKRVRGWWSEVHDLLVKQYRSLPTWLASVYVEPKRSMFMNFTIQLITRPRYTVDGIKLIRNEVNKLSCLYIKFSLYFQSVSHIALFYGKRQIFVSIYWVRIYTLKSPKRYYQWWGNFSVEEVQRILLGAFEPLIFALVYAHFCYRGCSTDLFSYIHEISLSLNYV